MRSSIADYNDYGGFDSSPIYGGTVTGSGSGSPGTTSTRSGGSWYDGISDFAGSIFDTAVKIGVPILAAKTQADIDKATLRAQDRAAERELAFQREQAATRAGTGSAGFSGVPQWAIYAGAAVVGVGVLALIVSAARK